MADAADPMPGHQEARHLARVFAEMVQRHLLDHAAIQASPAWTEKAERARRALMELHQAIGATPAGAGAEPPPREAPLRTISPEDEVRGGREVAEDKPAG